MKIQWTGLIEHRPAVSACKDQSGAIVRYIHHSEVDIGQHYLQGGHQAVCVGFAGDNQPFIRTEPKGRDVVFFGDRIGFGRQNQTKGFSRSCNKRRVVGVAAQIKLGEMGDFCK